MPWLKKSRRSRGPRHAWRASPLSLERLEWRLALSGAPPTANNDTYLVAIDTPLIVAPQGVLTNDSDPEGDALSVELFTGPRHGVLSLAPDGSFTYSPVSGYVGLDSFAYIARDGSSGSGLAAATLRVGLAAGAPVIDLDGDDSAAIGLDYSTAFTSGGPAVSISDFDATLTDSDSSSLLAAHITIANPMDGLAEALTANTTGTSITASYDASAGRLDLTGSDSLEHYRQVIRSVAYRNNAVHPQLDVRQVTVVLNDGGTIGPAATAHVSILAINHPPTATDDAFATVQGSTLTLLAPGLLSNDADADSDALTAELANPPASGLLQLAADGSLTYTPDLGFVGVDQFTYVARDGAAASNLATVIISVAASSDLPVAVNDVYFASAATALDIAASGVLANDTLPSGVDMAVLLISSPLHGVVTLRQDGSFTYAPDAGFSGTDGFSYQLQAGEQVSDVASVTVTVLDATEAVTLLAVADTYLLNVGEASVRSSDSLIANDSAGGGAVATVVSGPTLGALVLDANGEFTYVPGGSFRGIDGFTYRIADSGEESSAHVDLLSQAADLVRKLYRHVLARDPSLQEWQFWTNAITDGGQTLGNLGTALLDSDEYLTRSIEQYYRDYLHREAEASGLAFWHGQWRAYGGPDTVQIGILASDELRSIGGDNDGWVTELYRRFLNREPEQVGFDFWTGTLANAALNHLQVAHGFVTSLENSRNLSAFWYGHYLGRPILAEEQAQRVSELDAKNPSRAEDVQVNVVDSLEYRSVPPQPSTGVAQRV